MTKKPHLPYRDPAEIERVVRQFGDCTLPCDEWTHAAHLTVGLWHAREYPPGEALDRIRAAIQRYNAGCVTANSIGYHETITRFYMWLIGRYLAGITKLAGNMEPADLVAVTNGLVEHAALTANHPFAYYRRDVLMSDAARTNWVPPDLQPME
jgi:hypothetical protein